MSTTPAQSTALVTSSTKLSTFLGIEKGMMLDTIKAQCFKGKRPDEVSDEQLAAFCSVASSLELNPLLPGMLYAYPERNGGITPIVGPDGTFKKLSEMKGVTYECEVFPEDVTLPPTHATARIYTAECGERPHTYTAIFKEWAVSNNPNWNTRPRHMLWLRAIKQCARQVIHGMPMDEDERHIAGLVNVTPDSAESTPEEEKKSKRPPAPERTGGVKAAQAEAAAAASQNAPTEPKEKTTRKCSQDKVVEGEFTESSPTAAPIEMKPAETKTEEVAPTPPAEAPKAEKLQEPAAQAERVQAITGLTDGQVVTIEGAEVVECVAKVINSQPSVEAELKGGYVGKVFHIGGKINEPWRTNKPVNVTLKGRKLKSGAVISIVEKVEVSADAEGVTLE